MPQPLLSRATSSALQSRKFSLEPSIRVRGLQHYYGEGELRKQVLFENNLDIQPGEIVIMTGPSGSGKTTLLTLIGTLRKVQEGSLQILGQELRGAGPDTLINLRRKIGFIFQAHNLFGSLSARQNVRMAMELFQTPEEEMNRLAESMLTRLGLGNRIDYKPDSLSGGQKQRVAIARGLVNKPRLILADEPTAALDEKSGREVVTLFQELARKDGCTILMVTHDNRILDVADRIVNMVDGYIKSDVVVQEASMICEFLQQSELFRELTPKTLAEMADKMISAEYDTGAVVIRQGEPGESFYLIRDGSLSVSVDKAVGDDSQTVATLTPGDFFGESSLLTGEPRNATVIAKEPVVLYTLSKTDFQSALNTSASFREEVQKALFNRQ
jgi:putative ABC transport system ATP-binding protein